MKKTGYTVEEMKNLLDEMSGIYDLARLVDPIECRVIDLKENGKIGLKDSCFDIWDSGQKCENCSSARACMTGCHQMKTEHFGKNVYQIQSSPIKLTLDDGGECDAVVELVSVQKDVNNAARANDRAAENIDHRAAEYKAVHDELTAALTPNAFNELVRKMILNDPDEKWVMITANIVDFRLVNALFGVRRGNEVLVRTSGALIKAADEAGGICGRAGGDKFMLFIPEDKFSEEGLNAIFKGLAKSYSSGLYTFCIHFGVYKIESISVPVSVMCDRANAAMHTLRGNMNKSVAYFDDSIMKKSLFAQEVISGFDEALKSGQFKMYLQPLTEKDGHIFGAEALVRWERPDGTVVMPGDFIETLEHAGLIYKLDMYMWECAVKQLKAWKDTDMKDVTISVNMSAKDFYSINVYDVLTGLVDEYGVDPSMLRVEITETALLKDPKKSNVIISKLRDKGFLIEIDDFGKGYSSLNMLKDITADVLKIDMSLLREIETKERSRIILGSVVNMATSLDMDVITEGIETEEQLRSLTEMGCKHFQGYYFYKPMPAQDFSGKLM